MASLNNHEDNNRSKKRFRKYHSLKIDMTPMVDLGFLLITFFVFTTRLSEPNVMKLAMPKEDGAPTPTRCSETITLLPVSADRIGWYDCAGGVSSAMKQTDIKQLRILLQQKQAILASSGGKRTDLVVIIKPLEFCDYQTLISVLDEMTINGVTRYAMVEPEPEEVLQEETGRQSAGVSSR